MNFYLENGNVSGKVRNDEKAKALVELTEVLDTAGYVLDGKSLFKTIGTAEKDGETKTIRVRVDLVVTDR